MSPFSHRLFGAMFIVVLASSQAAHAGGAGFGKGETISHLASLPEDSPAYATYNSELSGFGLYHGPKLDRVGYKYTEFWFILPVWTSGGEYVVYSGTRYISVGTDAKTVAGELDLPDEVLGVPFLYRVPWGWLLIGGVMVFFVGSTIVGRATLSLRLRRLLADPTHKEALRIALNAEDGGLNRAVDFLVSKGISLETAQRNMQLLLAQGQ